MDSMNWEAIGALGEGAGALAVIATLVYLAIQVSQNFDSIRATAELEASGRFAQFVSRIPADQNLKRIRQDVAEGHALSAEDHFAYVWLIAEFFHTSEGIFIQFSGVNMSATWSDSYSIPWPGMSG